MALKANDLQWCLCIIVLLAALVQQTRAQTPSPDNDFFAPLKDPKESPHGISNQNFTKCCLRALDSWRQNPSNKDIFVESSKNPLHIFSNADELGNAKEQFPCGAEYDDKTNNKDGAPRVKISYVWCKSNCGGWQRSRSSVLEQWVQPFVGFVLPAAVFCLNVPRKTVINIPDALFMDLTMVLATKWKDFMRNSSKISALGKLPFLVTFVFESITVILRFVFGALLAAGIGLFNVVFWVIVVFSTAAPMILSGLYEATIDRQVLRAIEKDVSRYQEGETKKNNPHRVKYHIHLLYAVLVGNLTLGKTNTTIQNTDPESPKDQGKNKISSAEDPDNHVEKVWTDVGVLIHDLDPADEKKVDKYEKEKEKTRDRLKTMLACQASFGASVGAPVAFYLGSFLFSVFGNHSKLGDSDVSLSLAFGEWWMTIPHVAIVSGCLLAGNNPNTLEAIGSGIEQGVPSKKEVPSKNDESSKNGDPSKNEDLSKEVNTSRKHDGVLTAFYKSDYQPVWMWERGRNKRNWFKKVQALYPEVHTDADPKGLEPSVTGLSQTSKFSTTVLRWLQERWDHHVNTPALKKVPTVRGLQWTFLLLTASILIVIPFVLAYVTSFYTPTIGLSCRTFTFVLYFVFQSLLTLVWLYDFTTKEHGRAKKSIWVYLLAWLFFVGSSFTAIIGTFMQIIGVYRNCLCSIPMGYWGSRNTHFAVSTNSADGIYYAGLYWLSTGIASICLLVICCYFGWWYQRHWRMRFDNIVDKIMDVVPLPKPAAKTGDKKGGRGALGGVFKGAAKSGKNGSTANLEKKTDSTTKLAPNPEKTEKTTNLENAEKTTNPGKAESAKGSVKKDLIPENTNNKQQPGQASAAPTAGNPTKDEDKIESNPK